MQVTVKVVGHPLYKTGFGEKILELPPGITVSELIRRIGLDENFQGMVTRSGVSLPPGEVLKPNDRIVIAPAYSGG